MKITGKGLLELTQAARYEVQGYFPMGSWRINLYAGKERYAATLGLLFRQEVGKRPLLVDPDSSIYLISAPADDIVFPTKLPPEEGQIARWRKAADQVDMLFTGWLRLFVTPRHIVILVREPQFTDRAFRDHLFEIICKLLFREDRFYIHSAAIQLRDQVSLFVAPGAHGKSTITLRLAQAGATILSEDHVIIRRDEAGSFLVSGCQDTARVTPKTEEMIFDAPLAIEPEATGPGGPKKLFELSDYFASAPFTDFPFERVFFNHIGRQFKIKPMSRQAAVLKLMYMTRSFFRQNDEADLAGYLDFFSDLAGGREFYDLELSPDLADLDRLVAFLA